jgi:hypothetical protein
LTTGNGRFTVGRARLALAMISTPGHRASRRRQREALPAWCNVTAERLRNLMLSEEAELPPAERPRNQSTAAVAAWLVDENSSQRSPLHAAGCLHFRKCALQAGTRTLTGMECSREEETSSSSGTTAAGTTADEEFPSPPVDSSSRGTERRYGAGGEDGNFVAASNDGVPRCPSRTT